MSIQTLINYLRFTRRSEEAEAKSKHHLAIVIDKNYEPNGPFHEDNLVQVSKTDIQSQNNYKNIRHLIPDELYFVEVAQNQYKYYIKREQIVNGDIVIEYSQITTIITNVWETLVNQTVQKVTFNAVPNLYYSEVSNTIIQVYLEGIVVFSDTFKYHPDDISEVTNGEYILDFKDADGFTNLGIDYFLKRLANSNNEILKSEKRRTVNFIKNIRPGIITSFPRITQQGNKFILQYNYYAKGIPAQSFLVDNALYLEFTYIGAMMAVLNETIFYALTKRSDFEGHKHRDPFLTAYLDLIEDRIYYAGLTEALEILFFAPAFAIQELRTDFLWHLIDNTLNSSLTNFQGIDKEDIVLKVIEVLAQKENLKEKILQQLLAKHPSGKTRLELLYDKIDGENNQKFVQLIYGLWKKSKYTMPDEKQNKEFVTTTGPLFLPYESEKWLGLYFSNASTSFKDGMIKVDFETGKSQDVRRPNPKGGGYYITKEEIIEQYDYHPYYPIFIKNIEKQETTLELDAIVPAFLLFANQNKQFWHNVIKTGEYTLDAVTTLSGIGNLAKFRYLAKLGEAGSIIAKVKLTAGIVEVTSGVTNILLKLTGFEDTDLGKSLQEYLFWLELLSLSGEITVAIHNGLRKSAKEILEHEDDLRKTAKNADEAKQIDDVIEVLRRMTGMAENVRVSGIKMSVEEFKSGLKNLLSKNITPENAMNYIDEARIYFNHKIMIGEDGSEIIVQIATHNCVEVVKVVEDFLKTGKIKTAAVSDAQDYYELEKLYNRGFKTFELKTLRTKEEIMAIGERGILLCERDLGELSHVINIIKLEKDKLKYIEGQSFSNEMNLLREFKSFKFLKTN